MEMETEIRIKLKNDNEAKIFFAIFDSKGEEGGFIANSELANSEKGLKLAKGILKKHRIDTIQTSDIKRSPGMEKVQFNYFTGNYDADSILISVMTFIANLFPDTSGGADLHADGQKHASITLKNGKLFTRYS